MARREQSQPEAGGVDLAVQQAGLDLGVLRRLARTGKSTTSTPTLARPSPSFSTLTVCGHAREYASSELYPAPGQGEHGRDSSG